MEIDKNRRIGLLIDSIEDHCEFEICQGIIDYFNSIDVQVIIFEGVHNFNNRNSQYISTVDMVKKSDLCGLIIFSSFFYEHMTRDELANYIAMFNTIPVVSIGESVKNITSVDINEEKALKALVDYLILEKNCRDFAFMFGPKSDSFSQSRLNTIINRISYYGIEVRENRIHHLNYVCHNEAKQETSILLRKSMVIPDAILCFDDYAAQGVTDYLEEKSIAVPGKIIVTGFDDVPNNSPFKNKIITVKQPFSKVGVESAKLLSRVIEGEKAIESVILNCELVLNLSNQKSQAFSIAVEKQNSLNKILLDILEKEGERFLRSTDKIAKIIHHINQKTWDVQDFLYNNYLEIADINEIKNFFTRSMEIIESNFGRNNCFYLDTGSLEREITEVLINKMSTESHRKDDQNWMTTLGGQIMLRSYSLKELLRNLPFYLEESNCKNCLLFLYKKDFIFHNSKKKELPLKTELIYSSYINGSEAFTIPTTFNTQEVLPQWDLLDYKGNYIYIMLFYNKEPVGYLFLEYKDKVSPKTYGAIRINLETSLHNILRLEEGREEIRKNRNNFISEFNKLKTPLMNIIYQFKILKSSIKSNWALSSLGTSLYKLRSLIQKTITIEEEINSFTYNQEFNISSLLKSFISKNMSSEKVNSSITKGLIIKFDNYAMDLILNLLRYQIKEYISSISLKERGEVYLSVEYRNLFLKDKDLESIFSDSDQSGNPDFKALSSIKSIIMASNNSFSITSDKDGTKILFKFELIQKETTQISDNKKTEERQGNTIVILEPNIELRELTLISLKEEYKTISIDSIIDINSSYLDLEKISIVISDLPSTLLSNYKEIKEEYRRVINLGIPIIFTSQTSSEKEKIRALELGGIDFLKKPYSETELKYKLKNHFIIEEKRKNVFLKKFETSLKEMIKGNSNSFDTKKYRLSQYLKKHFNLTSREIEIVLLMEKKLYHREIAQQMNLTEQTIRNMSHSIYKKCSVSGKKELIELIGSDHLLIEV